MGCFERPADALELDGRQQVGRDRKDGGHGPIVTRPISIASRVPSRASGVPLPGSWPAGSRFAADLRSLGRGTGRPPTRHVNVTTSRHLGIFVVKPSAWTFG